MKKQLLRPDDLLKFVLPSGPQISPDGRFVAFSRKHYEAKYKAVSNVWLMDSKTGRTFAFTSGDSDSRPQWSPKGDALAFIRRKEKAKPQIFLISMAGGEACAISDLPEGDIGDFKWSPDGKGLAFTFRESDPDFSPEASEKRKQEGLSTPPRILEDVYYRLDGDEFFGERKYNLFVLDHVSGKHRKIFSRARYGVTFFDWNPNSAELVLVADLGKEPMLQPWFSRLYSCEIKSGKCWPFPDQKPGVRTGVAWSPDGKKIAFSGIMGTGEVFKPKNQHLYMMDVRSGKTTDLTGGEDYCLDAAGLGDVAEIRFNPVLKWSPDSRRVFTEIGWHGNRHIASVDCSGGKLNFHVAGEGFYALGGISSRGDSVAYSFNSATGLPEVASGKLSKSRIEKVVQTKFNSEILSSVGLSHPESRMIESAEGVKIQVWMMKPVGFKPGRKYPAILQVHGGPHCMYGNGFFNEFQLLAASGFVVFFSNPRGSKGYGEEFCDCITGDWGNRDWEDIQIVIRHMCRQSFVDPGKLGIIGGSYGGYMTNWAISHTTAFKAAVTDRSVSNWLSLVGNSDIPNPTDSYFPGNPWDRPEKLWNQSPIKYFSKVQTPTLIVHSEGDLRCNIEQADQVFHALKLRGVPVRYVRYPAETSHGMSRGGPPDLRIHRLREILSWFKKYL